MAKIVVMIHKKMMIIKGKASKASKASKRQVKKTIIMRIIKAKKKRQL
jgi:hypothetical protein